MKKYENYIWSKNAKFIDNENIAYITNRPYFSYKTKNEYIGITNIKTLKNKIIVKTKSDKLEFDQLNKDGLIVISAEGKYILNKTGDIIK
ncbi:MAG: hypothetical protein ACRDCW_13260 [Sarcina sp.]